MTQVELIYNEILIIRALTSNARVWRRAQTVKVVATIARVWRRARTRGTKH